ncbi:MAG: hypothetical protein KKH22_04460 [Proteobacteria bacterium]|nr:hypothetical protein [Pseudomonadota bacterium]
MLTGNATEPSRTSFRGPSPRLDAAQPSNQASGDVHLDIGQPVVSAKIKMLDEMIRQELNL